jgi:hypothetical protein
MWNGKGLNGNGMQWNGFEVYLAELIELEWLSFFVDGVL